MLAIEKLFHLSTTGPGGVKGGLRPLFTATVKQRCCECKINFSRSLAPLGDAEPTTTLKSQSGSATAFTGRAYRVAMGARTCKQKERAGKFHDGRDAKRGGGQFNHPGL
jgi:hypothetical protein